MHTSFKLKESKSSRRVVLMVKGGGSITTIISVIGSILQRIKLQVMEESLRFFGFKACNSICPAHLASFSMDWQYSSNGISSSIKGSNASRFFCYQQPQYQVICKLVNHKRGREHKKLIFSWLYLNKKQHFSQSMIHFILIHHLIVPIAMNYVHQFMLLDLNHAEVT